MKTGVLRRFKGNFSLGAWPARFWILFSFFLLVGSRVLLSAPTATVPAPVVEGSDGWLFLGSELRFLSFKKFWATGPEQTAGQAAPPVAKGDPLKAVTDFNKQLKADGVRLIVMPVPPKAWVSTHAPAGVRSGVEADSLGGFYKELEAQGVEVLDLRPAFAAREASAEAMYCKTDSHWSGRGCVVAAQALASRLRDLLPADSRAFVGAWQEVSISGDLAELRGTNKTAGESLSVRRVSDASGTALPPNPASPLLLLGDSHTLVFRDFLAESAGLAEQLALETGTIPEVIGTRGSGANAVRVNVFRRNLKDPAYLASKKVVIWCFAAREFTEADQGWQIIPLRRAEVKSR
jgi:hypothetical protein